MADSLEKHLNRIFEAFLPLLQELYGNNLVSLILYGSAAKGAYTPGVSDVNLLMLLDKPAPEKLVELGKRGLKIIEKERISLQILTRTEFVSSSDVFPMEHLDIIDSRKILYGEDPAAELKVTNENLRRQVEERLRGGITSFRQTLVSSKGEKRFLKVFMNDWFGTQNALFRSILRLKDEGISAFPEKPEDLLKLVAEKFELDPKPLMDSAALRRGEKRDPQDVCGSVLLFLTELAARVDSL